MQVTKSRQITVLTRSKDSSNRVTIGGTVSLTYIASSPRSEIDHVSAESRTDSLIRDYVSELWAADWDNDDDAVYDK